MSNYPPGMTSLPWDRPEAVERDRLIEEIGSAKPSTLGPLPDPDDPVAREREERGAAEWLGEQEEAKS